MLQLFNELREKFDVAFAQLYMDAYNANKNNREVSGAYAFEQEDKPSLFKGNDLRGDGY